MSTQPQPDTRAELKEHLHVGHRYSFAMIRCWSRSYGKRILRKVHRLLHNDEGTQPDHSHS